MCANLKSLLCEAINFINHQPHPDHDFNSTTSEIELKDTDIYKTVVSRISSTKGFIFLIGPWGSGKSTLVRQIMKNEKKSFSFTKRSFLGVSNETAAKLVVFTFLERASITLVTGFLFYRLYLIFKGNAAPSEPPLSIIIQGIAILSLLILADVPRILYLIGHFIAAFYRFIIDLLDLNVSKKILFLEDLDRSSLARQQLFGFLSNIPFLKRTIVWKQRLKKGRFSPGYRGHGQMMDIGLKRDHGVHFYSSVPYLLV